ncbi:hypothetical protein D3C80_1313640 [compost metagenome]
MSGDVNSVNSLFIQVLNLLQYIFRVIGQSQNVSGMNRCIGIFSTGIKKSRFTFVNSIFCRNQRGIHILQPARFLVGRASEMNHCFCSGLVNIHLKFIVHSNFRRCVNSGIIGWNDRLIGFIQIQIGKRIANLNQIAGFFCIKSSCVLSRYIHRNAC